MSMRLRGRHATAVGVGARLAASCLIFQDDVTVGRGAQVSKVPDRQAGRESFKDGIPCQYVQGVDYARNITQDGQ